MTVVTRDKPGTLITLSVWVHAAVTGGHAAAHIGAGVLMPLPATLYIWLVIIIGPIVGWWLVRSGRVCAGSGVVGACMMGALLFGALNHFVWPGADRVDTIAAGMWRVPFQATAVLLALTETFGVIAGLYGVRACLRKTASVDR
jgi:hypothetical protein